MAGVDDGRTANGDADLLDAKDDPNEISISSEQPNDSSDPNEISIGDDIDTPIKQSPEVATANMDGKDISNDSPTNDTEAEENFQLLTILQTILVIYTSPVLQLFLQLLMRYYAKRKVVIV